MNFKWIVTMTCVLCVCRVPLSAATGMDSSGMDSTRTKRLSSFCRLWGTLKYFHPYLAYRKINWDSSFVASAKDIEKSTSTEDYRKAIRDLLRGLADPVTRVLDFNIPGGPRAGDISPRWRFSSDSILVVTIDRYSDLMDSQGAMDKLRQVGNEIPKSKGVVFDIRSPQPLLEDERGYLDYVFDGSGLGPNLSSSPLRLPGQRARMHLGFTPHEGSTSGGYSSAFYVLDGSIVNSTPEAHDIPTAFLLNENAEIPSVALGLQSAGKAVIVAEGILNEASCVTTQRFDAGEGLAVEFRLGELVNEDGSGGLGAITVVPTRTAKDEPFETALDLVRRKAFRHTGNSTLPAHAYFVADNSYEEMPYPSAELRLLAAARIWVTFNYFFPYKHLMNEDWNMTLEEFIPKLLAVKDSVQYALTVAEMITRVHDSHAHLQSRTLDQFFGTARPPIIVRLIENQPVVTSFLNDSVASASGVHIGDIIEEVDGEKASSRLRRYERYIAASTEQSLHRNACRLLLNGRDSSVVTLTLHNEQNSRKTVQLFRRQSYSNLSRHVRSGEIIRLLPGEIGYADLDRLPVSMVDSMFNMFRNAKAIVFDMRGYPMETAWQIAPRLTEKSDVAAASFYRPTVMYPDGRNGEFLQQAQRYSFTQSLPNTSKWRYKGKTVMLIDERTQSQAEHTGLFLRAANGTKFIGTHTAGANGDVTNFSVPGGLTIWFSGQGVTYPDGTQLQRIGLVPDVEVQPTIRGIREGRDEVLEKAIEYLKKD